MKAIKDAQKRATLKGSTFSGSKFNKPSASSSAKGGATAAIGSGKKKSNSSAVEDEIKFQPHRDVIDAGKIVRELGDDVNTRYVDHDDLDMLDRGLGMNHDEEGQQMIDEARMAAGDRRQAVSLEIKSHLFGKNYVAAPSNLNPLQPPNIEAKTAFVGHNRNTVTCCTVLDMTIFYGDKTGHVFRAEPNATYSRAATSSAALTSSSSPTTTNSHQQDFFYHRVAMNPKHKGAVLSLAVSDTRGNRPANWGKERSSVDMSVLNYLCSGGQDGAINVWKAVSGEYVGILKMHRSPVTGLCFRQWSSMLVSASADTTVRLWSVPEMHCEDKYFGHNGPVNSISSLRKERCATAGADRTVRHWKLDAATQVEFSTNGSAAECVAMIDDVHIVAGSATGELFLFDVNRRNPLQTIEQPHGAGFVGDGTGLEMLEGTPSAIAQARGNAITAIAALPYGDIVATASYNGTIALWHFTGHAATTVGGIKKAYIDAAKAAKAAKDNKGGDNKSNEPRATNRLNLLATIPCTGCVNSLQFSPDGSVLLASVGKDQRTGRWLTVRNALNGVMIIPLHKKGEDEVRAVTDTTTISSISDFRKTQHANTDIAVAEAKAMRKIYTPLLADPSHQPTTAEAKLEARRKKRNEMLQRRKEARESHKRVAEAQRKKKEAGGAGSDAEGDEEDAFDSWNGVEDEEVAAPAKKKAVAEKANGKKTAVVPTPTPAPVVEEDDEDGDEVNGSDDDDFSDNGDAPAFKLGKDGQFVFDGADDGDSGDDDDEDFGSDDDGEDEIVAAVKKGVSAKKAVAVAGKKKVLKKKAPTSVGKKAAPRKESAAPMKKKVVGGKKKH